MLLCTGATRFQSGSALRRAETAEEVDEVMRTYHLLYKVAQDSDGQVHTNLDFSIVVLWPCHQKLPKPFAKLDGQLGRKEPKVVNGHQLSVVALAVAGPIQLLYCLLYYILSYHKLCSWFWWSHDNLYHIQGFLPDKKDRTWLGLHLISCYSMQPPPPDNLTKKVLAALELVRSFLL